MSEFLKMNDGNKAGDFVKTLVNPETGETGFQEGFHVHKTWAKQCQTFDQVMAKVEQVNKERQDIEVTLEQIMPDINDDGKFVIKIDDREFSPT